MLVLEQVLGQDRVTQQAPKEKAGPLFSHWSLEKGGVSANGVSRPALPRAARDSSAKSFATASHTASTSASAWLRFVGRRLGVGGGNEPFLTSPCRPSQSKAWHCAYAVDTMGGGWQTGRCANVPYNRNHCIQNAQALNIDNTKQMANKNKKMKTVFKRLHMWHKMGPHI